MQLSQATTKHLSSYSQQYRFTRGFEAEDACGTAAWEAICLWISKCSSGAWYDWKQMLQQQSYTSDYHLYKHDSKDAAEMKNHNQVIKIMFYHCRL